MPDRVFDDRVGLWIVTPSRLPDRLPAIRAHGAGLIRDLFLPRTARPADLERVKRNGLGAHLWAAVDGLSADDYADRCLADILRTGAGAYELNIELGDDRPLPAFVDRVIRRIRATRRYYRLRINLAAWKGHAIPAELLREDPNLYVCMQNYTGNMDGLLSSADMLDHLLLWGAPIGKTTVCYAAFCTVLDSPSRIRTLPDLSRTRRGVIFHDDLMADAGLL